MEKHECKDVETGACFRGTSVRHFSLSCTGAGVDDLGLGETDLLLEAAFALAFLITSTLSFLNIRSDYWGFSRQPCFCEVASRSSTENLVQENLFLVFEV